MSEDVRLMLGDCLDLMSMIPDGSVDLIASDPPYGTTACAWDSVIDLDAMWSHYRRILKPCGAVVLTASQPFTSALVMSNPKWFRYCLVWEKTNGTGFLDAKKRPLKCHEDICIFSPGNTTYNPQKWLGKANHSTGRNVGRARDRGIHRGDFKLHKSDISGMKYPRSVLCFGKHSSTESDHTSQKPVALLEYLIRTYSNEGDVVFDSCMGSGTTGVACRRAWRRFVGIEKDPAYFEIARQRIEAEDRPLFPETKARPASPAPQTPMLAFGEGGEP